MSRRLRQRKHSVSLDLVSLDLEAGMNRRQFVTGAGDEKAGLGRLRWEAGRRLPSRRPGYR